MDSDMHSAFISDARGARSISREKRWSTQETPQTSGFLTALHFVAGVLHRQPQPGCSGHLARMLGVHLPEGLHRVGGATVTLVLQFLEACLVEIFLGAAVWLDLVLGAVDLQRGNRG